MKCTYVRTHVRVYVCYTVRGVMVNEELIPDITLITCYLSSQQGAVMSFSLTEDGCMSLSITVKGRKPC